MSVSRLLNIKYIGTHHTMYEYYLHYLPPIMRPPVELHSKSGQKLVFEIR